MNTNYFTIVASILLVVVYLIVLQIEPKKFPDKALFIPETAIAYYEQKTGIKSLENSKRNTFSKTIASIDIVKVAQKLEFEEKQIESIQKTIALYYKFLSEDIVKELFSKSFAVAIDPSATTPHSTDFELFLRSNSVLISEPKHQAGLLTVIAESYSRFSKKFDVVVKQYGIHHIYRITLENEQVSVVVIEGMLIASFNELLLKKCIDTYDGEIQSLNSLADYQTVQEHFESKTCFFYLSVARSRDFVKSFISERQFSGKDLIEKELATTKGFSGVGYGISYNRKVLAERIAAHYQKDLVNDITSSVLDSVPSKSSMLKLTSPQPVAYYWSNTFDLYHILPYLLQDEKISPQMKDFAEKVRQSTGKSITEILSWLGKEVSLVVESGSSKTFLALPMIATFIQVKEGAKLQATLADLSNYSAIPMTQKTYKNATYHYWSTSTQDGLMFLYGFWNDYLFFSNSVKYIRSIMDNIEAGKTLNEINGVAGIDPGISSRNNSITYSNNVELIEMMKRFLNFASTMVGMEDRQLAYKITTIVSDVVNPFLDGLKSYNKSCTRSYFTSDFVFIDSFTYVDPN